MLFGEVICLCKVVGFVLFFSISCFVFVMVLSVSFFVILDGSFSFLLVEVIVLVMVKI